MWRRGRNRANPGMVPPRGRGSDNRSRTHGRDALSGDSGDGRSRNGGCSGGGCKSGHDDGSRGWGRIGEESRARVGVAGKERRQLLQSGLEVVSSRIFTMAVLEKEKRWRGGEDGEVSEVIWNERGGGGGGGGGGGK